MTIYLISNNSLLEGLCYENGIDLEIVRIIRPLSIIGEANSKRISEFKDFQDVEKIYSSFHSSALSTAKDLARNLDLEIYMNNNLNDCKVGVLGSKNMKMVKGLQDHDFNYKLQNGESLNDVGIRIAREIEKMVEYNENVAIFTHKRAILGYLLRHCNVGYNLDDSLILEFEDKQVYDDSESEFDIYKLEFDQGELKDISVM